MNFSFSKIISLIICGQYLPDSALSAGTREEPLKPHEFRRALGLRKNFLRFCGGVGQPEEGEVRLKTTLKARKKK